MIIDDVVEDIATQLATITGLQVRPWVADAVQPPTSVVAGGRIDYDRTYRRGSDQIQITVTTLHGPTSDHRAYAALSAYADGSGSTSIKAVLESGTYTSFDAIRVSSCEFAGYTVAGQEYAALIHTVDIIGQGA